VEPLVSLSILLCICIKVRSAIISPSRLTLHPYYSKKNYPPFTVHQNKADNSLICHHSSLTLYIYVYQGDNVTLSLCTYSYIKVRTVALHLHHGEDSLMSYSPSHSAPVSRWGQPHVSLSPSAPVSR
jgi:hypothetical protein